MQELGISSFGPSPLLQIAGAVLGIALLAGAVYKGTRDKKLSADQEPMPGLSRWYFDGPLNAALETLRDSYRVLHSIDNNLETLSEKFRTHARNVEEIKDTVKAIKDSKNRRR